MEKDSAAEALERYLEAQEPVFGRVLEELRAGAKALALDVVYFSANQRLGSKRDGRVTSPSDPSMRRGLTPTTRCSVRA